MAFLDESTQTQVKEILASISKDVELVVYTGSSLVVPGRDEPGHQRETLELLKEVASLNDHISVVEKSIAGDSEAQAAGISLAPTTLLREGGSSRTNIRFIGLPSGYEFQTLIQTLLMLGTGEALTSETSKDKLAELGETVTLQSFVTPTCPYCPQAVLTAFSLAFDNENIVAEGIEANEFPMLSQQYRISGVPDTVIKGHSTERVLGGQPERVFVETILKAAQAGVEA
ncbi:MAG: thioredoxin family protein [Trueperaceae bacterium]|nr:thioredoxin family protein [Trueperaceae bacterium]